MWRQLRARHLHRADDRTRAGVRVGPAQVTGFDAAPPAQSFYSGADAPRRASTSSRPATARRCRPTSSLPSPASEPGPYPTVVEYSGYDPSNPRETTFPPVFTNLGYAYVGVNIRGTGCSGGSFLPFEPVQSLDGYDAIEADRRPAAG